MTREPVSLETQVKGTDSKVLKDFVKDPDDGVAARGPRPPAARARDRGVDLAA